MGKKSPPRDLCLWGFHHSSGENMRAEFTRKILLLFTRTWHCSGSTGTIPPSAQEQTSPPYLLQISCLSPPYLLLISSRSPPYLPAWCSQLWFVTAHPSRTESPLCCQEMQVTQSTQTAYGKHSFLPALLISPLMGFCLFHCSLCLNPLGSPGTDC